jgi:uncharacterized membrane protein SirB2
VRNIQKPPSKYKEWMTTIFLLILIGIGVAVIVLQRTASESVFGG